jgi:hypothetical protein
MFRRCRAFAANTHGIIPLGIDQQARFQADIALPIGPKIVDIPKAFAWVEAECTEPHVSGIGAVVAIILAIDVKFMRCSPLQSKMS